MKNVNISIDPATDECVIRIKLKERHGASKTGKTTIIATSEGNVSLPDHPEIKLGLNVYVGNPK